MLALRLMERRSCLAKTILALQIMELLAVSHGVSPLWSVVDIVCSGVRNERVGKSRIGTVILSL